MMAKNSNADLHLIRDLLETGKVVPVVERTYGSSEVPDALRSIGEGHAERTRS